jgi:hypothetical protein
MPSLSSAALLLLALLPGPNAVPDWSLHEQPRTYAAANLYQYIDGAADLFISFGFRRVVVGDYVYSGEDEGWITVDIYDMESPLHAFGIYHAEKPPQVQALPIGTQCYSSESMIAFWQGRYYVKVMLIFGEHAPALRAFALTTAGKLPARAQIPPELKRLPVTDRIPGSERYIKQSALGHKFLTEVISANYGSDETVATLYIADLATPEAAAAGLGRLRQFEAEAGEEAADLRGVGEEAFAARDPYYGDMLACRQDRFLLIAIATGEQVSRAFLQQLLQQGTAHLLSQNAPKHSR